MSMEETYKEQILEEILREFLEDNTIPTADELLEAYEERVSSTRDMTVPFLSDTDYSVEYNSDSSASAFNSFFECALSDLKALYAEIWERTTDSMESYDRWRMELDGMYKRLVDLENRIDSLLFLRQDTVGYYNHIDENLTDFSKIDLTNTTAKIDVANHIVTMGETTSATDKLDMNSITTESASFALLNRKEISFAKDAPETSILKALKDVTTEHWQTRVKTVKQNKDVSGELKVKLADSAVDVSRIVYKLHSSDTNSSVIIVAQYSNDNHNWYNLPTDNYTQSVDKIATFVFPTTSMTWVKFILTKVGPDDIIDGQYVYEFGAQSIEFYTTAFSTSTGSIFMSKELQALDDDGDPIEFSKVALETCQTVPEDTKITYWVKALNDDEETTFAKIAPYNIDNAVDTMQVDFGEISETEETSLVKVSKDVSGSSPESALFFAQYPMVTDKFALIGTNSTTAYKISSASSANIVLDSLALYRNVGPLYGTTTEVREAPLGWFYDSTKTYLNTTISIENPDGKTIDFGPAGALLDGKLVHGSIVIPKGIHTFRTHINNTGIISSGTYLTETTLSAADTSGKYPYNHQKLIEGYNYSSSFTGVEYYSGVDVFCGNYCSKVSIFDLLNNTEEDDYSRFAIDTVDISGTIYTVFIVRFNPNISDHTNEVFTLSYKTKENVYDTIVLKAELITENSEYTPQFTAYRLKLGI